MDIFPLTDKFPLHATLLFAKGRGTVPHIFINLICTWNPLCYCCWQFCFLLSLHFVIISRTAHIDASGYLKEVVTAETARGVH